MRMRDCASGRSSLLVVVCVSMCYNKDLTLTKDHVFNGHHTHKVPWKSPRDHIDHFKDPLTT